MSTLELLQRRYGWHFTLAFQILHCSKNFEKIDFRPIRKFPQRQIGLFYIL